MISREEARQRVQSQIDAISYDVDGDKLIILDSETIELEWGWVFFYTSQQYHETSDFRFALGGNAPYIVRQSDGGVFVTGTAYPIEKYIEDFLVGGQLSTRCR